MLTCNTVPTLVAHKVRVRVSTVWEITIVARRVKIFFKGIQFFTSRYKKFLTAKQPLTQRKNTDTGYVRLLLLAHY